MQISSMLELLGHRLRIVTKYNCLLDPLTQLTPGSFRLAAQSIERQEGIHNSYVIQIQASVVDDSALKIHAFVSNAVHMNEPDFRLESVEFEAEEESVTADLTFSAIL